MKTPTHTAPPVDLDRLVWMDEVLRIVSEHPEYPEPCPMLHEVAAKAAAEINKEWIMHMVREACRQTKESILADLNSLPNVDVDLPDTAAQDSTSKSNNPAVSG